MTDVKTTSERPIKDDIGTAYGLGAVQAMNEPLSQDENWTTAHNDRDEAHRIALAEEDKHYAQNHPDPEPPIEIFETPEQPTNNRADVQAAMRRNLINRRRRK